MRQVIMTGVLVSLLVVFAAGCGSISSMLAEPEWSENYALKAQCDIPEMNDGSMYSSGKTQTPEFTRGQRADDSRFSDVVFTFQEPKSIRKITLRRRSEDSAPVDINVFAMIKDDWKLISDTTRGAIKDDINIAVRTVTNKIKIRAQRATRTAKGKAALGQSADRGAGRRTQVERLLREALTFAEVEIYGLKPKTESKKS